jgi:hypothetical protein
VGYSHPLEGRCNVSLNLLPPRVLQLLLRGLRFLLLLNVGFLLLQLLRGIRLLLLGVCFLVLGVCFMLLLLLMRLLRSTAIAAIAVERGGPFAGTLG